MFEDLPAVDAPLNTRTPLPEFDLRAFLPETEANYRYAGSLTIPPCTEGVHWLVLKDALTVSDEDLAVHAADLRSMHVRFNGKAGNGRYAAVLRWSTPGADRPPRREWRHCCRPASAPGVRGAAARAARSGAGEEDQGGTAAEAAEFTARIKAMHEFLGAMPDVRNPKPPECTCVYSSTEANKYEDTRSVAASSVIAGHSAAEAQPTAGGAPTVWSG